MLYPVSWDNQEGNGLTFGPRPTAEFYLDAYRFRGPSYPQPDDVCQNTLCHPKKPIWITDDCGIQTSYKNCSGCSIQGCREDWYTNHTYIPGHPTLPDDMYTYLDCPYGSLGNCTRPSVEDLRRLKHPWSSPGTAPIFGEGCGANGGNPHGCGCQQNRLDNLTICSGNDARPYGSCCGPPVLFLIINIE